LRAALLLVPLLAAGCALVDQRTFDPAAGTPPVVAKPAPPAPQPDRALDGSPPFVTIRPGQDRGYDDALAQAVIAALARKRDAQFVVLTAVPPGTDAAQDAAVAALVPEAARLAGIVARRGVPAARVQLQARAEPNLAAPELRLYVR
jgi:hypothetical protein